MFLSSNPTASIYQVNDDQCPIWPPLSDSVEYLSGSKHYAAPDMRLVSLRYEDLVQDLEIEVIMIMYKTFISSRLIIKLEPTETIIPRILGVFVYLVLISPSQ